MADPEWPQHELLACEKELLGFYVTGHPLKPYASLIEKYCLHKTSALAQLPNRTMTRIGGLIAAVQNGISKKTNKPYSMVTLEDLEGSVQVLIMNENFDLRRTIMPIAPENLRMIEAARATGASAKFAGSGGAICGLFHDGRQYQALVDSLAAIRCTVLRPLIYEA